MDCSFHNDCFTCPYPDCIEGIGIKKVSLAKSMRVIDLHDEGMHPKQIAAVLNMSESQIYRYLNNKVKQKLDYMVSKYGEG